MELEQLRYPVGKYIPQPDAPRAQIDEWIGIIEAFPAKLKALVGSLSEEQLEAQYRPGSWTIRQVCHHVADSHINSYVRFKWTLTESNPMIKTYDQNQWAELPDAKAAPVEISLALLTALHTRWVYMLRNITDEQYNLTFIHPEKKQELNLKWLVGLDAWHCRHHYGHIELAVNSPVRV